MPHEPSTAASKSLACQRVAISRTACAVEIGLFDFFCGPGRGRSAGPASGGGWGKIAKKTSRLTRISRASVNKKSRLMGHRNTSRQGAKRATQGNQMNSGPSPSSDKRPDDGEQLRRQWFVVGRRWHRLPGTRQHECAKGPFHPAIFGNLAAGVSSPIAPRGRESCRPPHRADSLTLFEPTEQM